jgi:hypothetical protein
MSRDKGRGELLQALSRHVDNSTPPKLNVRSPFEVIVFIRNLCHILWMCLICKFERQEGNFFGRVMKRRGANTPRIEGITSSELKKSDETITIYINNARNIYLASPCAPPAGSAANFELVMSFT